MSFLRVELQHPEKLPPRVREELEQLVAALQRWAAKILPIDNIPVDDIEIDASQIVSGILRTARGGTGVNGSSAGNGYLLIGNGSGFTLAPLTQGQGIIIQNGAGSITLSVSNPSGHIHGLMRILGDGSTTTFNLLDIVEYLEHVGVNGSFVDPATFTLSSNRAQITFGTAPGAGQIVTIEYVIASL